MLCFNVLTQNDQVIVACAILTVPFYHQFIWIQVPWPITQFLFEIPLNKPMPSLVFLSSRNVKTVINMPWRLLELYEHHVETIMFLRSPHISYSEIKDTVRHSEHCKDINNKNKSRRTLMQDGFWCIIESFFFHGMIFSRVFMQCLTSLSNCINNK